MKKLFYFAFIASAFVACHKGDDMDPIISEFRINDVENNNQDFQAGELLTLNAAFTDDQELNQARFSWSRGTAFYPDSIASIFTSPNYLEWDSSYVADIASKSDVLSWTMRLPENIQGFWKVSSSVIDIEGNEGSKEINVYISDPTRPQFVIGNVAPSLVTDEGVTSWTAAAPADIQLLGNITDATGIDTVFYSLSKTGLTLVNDTLPFQGEMNIELTSFDFPEITSTGTYTLVMRVKNSLSKENQVQARLTVE